MSSTAMSPIQQLFQPGSSFGAYSISEKRKDVDGETGIKDKYHIKTQRSEKFVHKNTFDALQTGEDDAQDDSPRERMVVNLLDAVKPASANQTRKKE